MLKTASIYHDITLRRLLAKVNEFSESHRTFGLPDDLVNILNNNLQHDAGSNLIQ
jgi:hypothetical protein